MPTRESQWKLETAALLSSASFVQRFKSILLPQIVGYITYRNTFLKKAVAKITTIILTEKLNAKDNYS